MLGLETSSGQFILKIDGRWCPDETFTVDAATYSVGGKVEIVGMLRRVQVSATEEYTELEIITIRKGD